MYVYIMTCRIQYPCSKHASSPSLPHQAMLVYTCLSFIHSALSLTTLILGSGEQSFYTKCPNSFIQDCRFTHDFTNTDEKLKTALNVQNYSNQKSIGLQPCNGCVRKRVLPNWIVFFLPTLFFFQSSGPADFNTVLNYSFTACRTSKWICHAQCKKWTKIPL